MKSDFFLKNCIHLGMFPWLVVIEHSVIEQVVKYQMLLPMLRGKT